MGLDQYAYFEEPGCPKERFAYWRKHSELDSWMRELYHSKGHTEEFNCVDLELLKEDLDEYEKYVFDNKEDLNESVSSIVQNIKDDEDLLFIAKARIYLNNGCRVYYTNWY